MPKGYCKQIQMQNPRLGIIRGEDFKHYREAAAPTQAAHARKRSKLKIKPRMERTKPPVAHFAFFLRPRAPSTIPMMPRIAPNQPIQLKKTPITRLIRPNTKEATPIAKNSFRKILRKAVACRKCILLQFAVFVNTTKCGMLSFR